MRVPGSILARPDPLGLIHAWVNFSGTSGDLYDGENVSSVTRNGAGDYTVTWRRAFASATYVLTGLGRNDGDATVAFPCTKASTTPTTTSITVTTFDGVGTAVDHKVITLIAAGRQ